jgi:hypothetical protein
MRIQAFFAVLLIALGPTGAEGATTIVLNPCDEREVG